MHISGLYHASSSTLPPLRFLLRLLSFATAFLYGVRLSNALLSLVLLTTKRFSPCKKAPLSRFSVCTSFSAISAFYWTVFRFDFFKKAVVILLSHTLFLSFTFTASLQIASSVLNTVCSLIGTSRFLHRIRRCFTQLLSRIRPGAKTSHSRFGHQKVFSCDYLTLFSLPKTTGSEIMF